MSVITNHSDVVVLLLIRLRHADSTKLMPRLHLAVLTTRNETWCLWKQLSKF